MISEKVLSRILKYALISLSVVLISCAANKVEKEISVSPNKARIIGKIISIDPIDKTKSPDDLCSQYPCFAEVKIKSVNYGAGFPQLSINSNIKIKFVFTLAPTNSSMFPNMEEQYPGLKEGDEFTALVSYGVSFNSDSPNYQIYSYSLK